MKKFTLLMCGLLGLGAMAMAQSDGGYELPANFDAWNLNFKLPLEKMKVPQSTSTAPVCRDKPEKMREIARAATEPTEYFAAAQTFHSNYQFNYDGGAVTGYKIGITRDGDKVTISNLFNLAAQSTEWSVGVDYDVTGTYDEATGTITIPAPNSLENGTICGTIGTSFTEVLAAGTVTEDGKMTPAENLVLNVIGDFEAITTDMNFGIQNYLTEVGTSYGMQTLYRKFYATLPKAEPSLLAFNNTFDFGNTFPGSEATVTYTFFNMSSSDVDYAVTMEADDDAFVSRPEAGTIDAMSSAELTFAFVPKAIGDYEGLATIDYEGITATPEPLQALLSGEAVAMPDYSGIVKEGDFEFTTNIEFPFEMITLEDGTQAAQSGTHGKYGTSKLTAAFDIPAGSIGRLSWKGDFTNTGYWYQNAGGIFIDGAGEASWSTNETCDMSNTLEFGPGHHEVRFQYESLYYTGDEKNRMVISDLSLTAALAQESAVEVTTPEVNVGNFMLRDGNAASGESTIRIQNRGQNPLTVNSVASDNNEFTVTHTSTPAELLEYIDIPVAFNATTPGEKKAKITIETSAGTVSADVKALVRQMADFSSVVTEGSEYVTSYDTNESYPFEVKDGVAYNANSGEADDVATRSSFTINFTIPDGKAGYVSWEGWLYGFAPDMEQYWNADNGGVEMVHPMNSGSYPFYGPEGDISSALVEADEAWRPYLTCVPGNHSFTFVYSKNGDGRISERDLMQISDFKIRVEDFPEYQATPDKDRIDFGKTYVGNMRYLTATVDIKNTGSQMLEIYPEPESQAPFYGVVPDFAKAQFNNTVQVGIWFYPGQEGEFEGDVTFKSNAGDIVIHCTGSTYPAEGILLIGDVENQADGWSFYDADQDGDCWNLGYNLWGQMPEYVHSGMDCFGSPSYSPYGGVLAPDNWLFSPTLTIPEDGAMLRWYAAAHHHERYAENYSVYIVTPEEIADPDNLGSLTPVFTETLPVIAADEWQEHTVDLADYAGKDVTVAFRHHDTDGEYVLKIDDIFVYTMQKWNESGVDAPLANDAPVRTEIFSLDGTRLRTLGQGVNIVRATYSDGKVKTTKVLVK